MWQERGWGLCVLRAAMGARQVACPPSPLPNEGHSPEGQRAERAAGVSQIKGRWALHRDAVEGHWI